MLSILRLFNDFTKRRAFRRPCSCTSNPLGNPGKKSGETYIGCDTTNGRFGDVNAWICPQCGFIWLHYYVVYEGFSGSGRWYRGRIPEKNLSVIKPEEAVTWLERSNPCFYGGSYYGTEGKFLENPAGQIHVDL